MYFCNYHLTICLLDDVTYKMISFDLSVHILYNLNHFSWRLSYDQSFDWHIRYIYCAFVLISCNQYNHIFPIKKDAAINTNHCQTGIFDVIKFLFFIIYVNFVSTHLSFYGFSKKTIVCNDKLNNSIHCNSIQVHHRDDANT